MFLDFLTDGDWRDSYESRIVNPNCGVQDSGGYVVNCIQDILNVLKVTFEDVKGEYIYIDGKCFGRVDDSRHRVTVYAPCDTIVTSDDILLKYPYGKENFILEF